jgi:hypothetical protein
LLEKMKIPQYEDRVKCADEICRAQWARSKDDPSRKDEPDDDDDEAPETPLDEPAPTPIQDPPAEPDPHPYTAQP